MGGKNIRGKRYGDYVAQKIAWIDNSGHNIWQCACGECGHIIFASVYDLEHGRKKTKCPNGCHNYNQVKDIKLTPITNDPPTTDMQTIKISFNKNKDDGDRINPIIKLTPVDDNIDSNEIDNNEDKISTKNYSNVTWEYKKIDLLEMPCYYHIAHCIPADLSFGGETAKRINILYDMENKIRRDFDSSIDAMYPGDCLPVENVINLIAVDKKYQKSNYKIMGDCITNLCTLCYCDEIQFLAMPLIGSGGLGLDWGTVEDMVLGIFKGQYDDEENIENRHIHIVFCDITGKYCD